MASKLSRLGTSVRFALVLTVGLVAGFGLSVGRTVKAEREIEPEPNKSVADTS